MRRPLLIALLLGAATLGVYAQVTSFEFIGYDDDVYVYRNPHLVDGVGWEDVPAAFEAGRLTANWHPVTMLSLTLDTYWFGLDSPGSFHAVNVALHLLGTLLAFGALRALTGRDVESGLMAAAFALHPLHVESVTWVSERKDVLAGVFWWATTWLWVRWVREGSDVARRGAYATFALGLMAKPLLVTLPFTLLLFDAWPLRRRLGRELLWEKGPLFALVVIAIGTTLYAQSRAGAVAALEAVPFGARLDNVFVSYGVYLKQALWPTGLTVYYPHATAVGQALPSGGVVGAWAGLLAVLSAGAVWAWRRGQPAVLVGWLFFLGVLVPMIGLVQVGHAAHADRYMYIPLVGLALAVVVPLGDWARRRGGAAERGALVAALVVCAVWAGLAHRQAAKWRDTRTLFEHTLRHTTNNTVAHYNLGYWLQERGEAEGAQHHFAAAHAIHPDHPDAAVNLGLTRFLAGEHEAGIALIERGLRAKPEHPRGHLNLAIALVQRGEYDRADSHLGRVLEVAGPYEALERLRAHQMGPELAALRGDLPAVLARYDAALAHAPDDLVILRGAVLRFGAHPDQARRRRALALAERLVAQDRQHPARSYLLLARVQRSLGDASGARRSLEAARGNLGPAEDALAGQIAAELDAIQTRP